MGPFEVALLEIMAVEMQFASRDPEMVPLFLRNRTQLSKPESDALSVRHIDHIAMIHTSLSPAEFESCGMLFRNAWSSSEKGWHTVHFSFGRILTQLPDPLFARQCSLALATLSETTLWSVSCWDTLLEEAGADVLHTYLYFSSPTPESNPSQTEGRLSSCIDVLTLYPTGGHKLRKAD
jgi:hypothetical protein